MGVMVMMVVTMMVVMMVIVLGVKPPTWPFQKAEPTPQTLQTKKNVSHETQSLDRGAPRAHARRLTPACRHAPRVTLSPAYWTSKFAVREIEQNRHLPISPPGPGHVPPGAGLAASHEELQPRQVFPAAPSRRHF